jgi:phenylacetate-CoA ligase
LGKEDPMFIDMPLLNLRLYNSYRLKQTDLSKIVDSILNWQPELIEGYPSTISTLSNFIKKNYRDIQFKRLKMISVTAETLYEKDREIIESAFGVKVHNQYASSEGSPFIYECSKGNMHLLLFSGVLHKIRDRSKFVVSSFRSSRVRLFAYDIGDDFTLNLDDRLFGSDCGCKSLHPKVLNIGGRNDEYIYDENKDLVQRLDIAYKGLTGINESQIIQRQFGSIEVLVVINKEWKDEYSVKLTNNLKELLGKSMIVDIVKVENIELGANGKFRAVINKIIQSN